MLEVINWGNLIEEWGEYWKDSVEPDVNKVFEKFWELKGGRPLFFEMDSRGNYIPRVHYANLAKEDEESKIAQDWMEEAFQIQKKIDESAYHSMPKGKLETRITHFFLRIDDADGRRIKYGKNMKTLSCIVAEPQDFVEISVQDDVESELRDYHFIILGRGELVPDGYTFVQTVVVNKRAHYIFQSSTSAV